MEEKINLRRCTAKYRYRMPKYFPYLASDDFATPGLLWDGLKEHTTIHGLPNYYQSRGKVKKWFWIVAMLLMTAGLFYNMKGLTTNYLNYPVTVAISLIQQQQLVFPSVTICNLNPVRKSALDAAIKKGENGLDVNKANPAVSVKKRKKRNIAGSCGSWLCFQGFSYCVYSTVLSALDAYTACQNVVSTAHIVSVGSTVEFLYVQKLINNTFKGDSWLGAYTFSTSPTNKNFTYYDGTSTSTAQAWWNPDEPNGSGPCIRIDYITGDKLRDTNCSLPCNFICKQLITDSSCLSTSKKPTTRTTVRLTTTKLPNLITTATTTRTTTKMSTSKTTAMLPSTTTAMLPSTTTEMLPSTTTAMLPSPTTEMLPSPTTEMLPSPTTEMLPSTTTAMLPSTTTEMLTTTATEMLPSTTTEMLPSTTTAVLPSTTTEMLTTTATEMLTTTTEMLTTTTGMLTTTTEMLPSTTKEMLPSTTIEMLTTTSNDITTSTAAPFISSSTPSIGTKTPAIGCCCQCCLKVDGEETCNRCSNDTLESSANCSASIPPRSPSTLPPSPAPTRFSTKQTPVMGAAFKAPPPMNGSSFPERTAKTETFLAGELFVERMATLTMREKIDLGYSRKEMILDCDYADTECLESDFESFYNPLHGNCYVFNSGWNTSNKLRMATRSGQSTGLKMMVNIGQRDYIPNIGDSSGLRVVVHPQRRMSFPEDDGVTVSPGYFSSIAIKKSVVSLQPMPYGNCTTQNQTDVGINFYAATLPVGYSRQACEKTCYQKHVMEACQCMDPYLPSGDIDGKSSIPVCSSQDITQDDCRYAITKKFASSDLSCNCPDSCRSTSYTHHTSLRAWPSEKSRKATLARLSRKLGPGFNMSDEKLISDNLVEFELYFEELSYKLFEERPGYPVISYVSDLGGILGLWFGFAIFSFFEFFEFFADIIVLASRKVLSRKQNK